MHIILKYLRLKAKPKKCKLVLGLLNSLLVQVIRTPRSRNWPTFSRRLYIGIVLKHDGINILLLIIIITKHFELFIISSIVHIPYSSLLLEQQSPREFRSLCSMQTCTINLSKEIDKIFWGYLHTAKLILNWKSKIIYK